MKKTIKLTVVFLFFAMVIEAQITNIDDCVTLYNGYLEDAISTTSPAPSPNMHMLYDTYRNFSVWDAKEDTIGTQVELISYDINNGNIISFENTLQAATDVHFAATIVWEYFLSTHGRYGWDGLNGHIEYYINHVPKDAPGGDNDNAYSHFNVNIFTNEESFDSKISFGVASLPSTTIDALAHEFTHAVVFKDTKISIGGYAYMAGPIVEGLCDIFALCVENYVNKNPKYAKLKKQIWSIGEEALCYDNRRHDAPKLHGFPDTYEGQYYVDHTNLDWSDEVEVSYFEHRNATILTHWFYLLANGGKGINDKGEQFNVKGIGIEAAAQIVYNVINTRIIVQPGSDFAHTNFHDFASLAYQEAVSFGYPSYRRAVREAAHAVNIDNNIVPFQEGPDPSSNEEWIYKYIYISDFENWGIWNDGDASGGAGKNCYRSINNAQYATGGTGICVQLKDKTSGSLMYSDALDFSFYNSNFEKVQMFFDYTIVPDYTTTEVFEALIIERSIDGMNWYKIDEYTDVGSSINQGVTDIIGSLDQPVYLRFRCGANDVSVYIDQVEFVGGVTLCNDYVDNANYPNTEPVNIGIPCNCTKISSNKFEGGWSIFEEGEGDCIRYNDDLHGTNFANSGDYCIRLRDDSETSVLTSENLDWSHLDAVTIDFTYITKSMDSEYQQGEDFWLQLSTDGGTNYQIIDTWVKDKDFKNYERHYETVVIQGPFSSTTRIQFRCDASGNYDWVYLDDIMIWDCNKGDNYIVYAPPPFQECVDNLNNNREVNVVNNMPEYFQSKIKLSPNPAKDFIELNYELTNQQNIKLKIIDIQGQVIAEEHLGQLDKGRHSHRINTSSFVSGTYFLQVLNKEGQFENKRFVVIR